MLRNHVEKSCWARNGFSNAPTSGARRGGDGCSVSNAHFFGRRAEKFLWGTRDTKVSIWWRRGGSSENQGGENSSSKKATTSKGTLYALFTSMSHWFQIFIFFVGIIILVIITIITIMLFFAIIIILSMSSWTLWCKIVQTLYRASKSIR